MYGKIQWVTYQGIEILYNDRSGLRDEEIIKNVETAVELIMSSPKKDILYLIDNSNTIIHPEIKKHIEKAAKTIDPKVKKTAVLGASRAQQVLLNLYSTATGMNIKLFSDEETAKQWLIK